MLQSHFALWIYHVNQKFLIFKIRYYRHDRQVRRDFELQNMIGELAQRKNTPNADKISKVIFHKHKISL